ncbi:hybrid signal transduction histidine kinase L isoform X2 [Battus philenor]|uniref:hybrid signal transduction histidine kinase L isoform X2 n=1 Tax=Battus philenor TaxID=42288 RepID=UPI0035CEF118
MSVLNQSGEEQVECPLCMEPLEVDDLHFYPCTCGYQICRFCWNRIREGENGLCPACRKAYPENPADFTPLSQEQVAAIKTEKKAREQKRRNKTLESRRALANVRVVQNNLVFVVGLPVRLADPEILKRQEYFGKYGKIHKVVINQSTAYAGSQGPSASAYVTYVSPADALRAIQGVNNVTLDGRVLKGSLGTTKYCANFMKNQPCPKPDCMYLHELGDPEASFTKEEMHAGLHQVYERRLHNQLLQAQRDKPDDKNCQSSGNSSTNADKGSSKDSNQSNPIPTTVVTSSNVNIVTTSKSKKETANGHGKGKDNGSSNNGVGSNGNSKEAWPSLGSSPPSDSPARKQPSPKPQQSTVKSQENGTSESCSPTQQPTQQSQTKNNKENHTESKTNRSHKDSNTNSQSKKSKSEKSKQKNSNSNSISNNNSHEVTEPEATESTQVLNNAENHTSSVFESDTQQSYLSNELDELESDRHSLLENHDLLDNSDHSLLDDDNTHNLLNDANSTVVMMQRHREMLAGLVDNNHILAHNMKSPLTNGYGLLDRDSVNYLGNDRQISQINPGLMDQKELMMHDQRSRSEMLLRQNEMLARQHNVMVEPKHYNMPSSSIGLESASELLGANFHQNPNMLPPFGMRVDNSMATNSMGSGNSISANALSSNSMSGNTMNTMGGYMLHNQQMLQQNQQQIPQSGLVNGFDGSQSASEGRYLAENMDKFFMDFHKAQQMRQMLARGAEERRFAHEQLPHQQPHSPHYPHNMLSAERLEMEHKQRINNMRGNENSGSRAAGDGDDDLDFDPFKETQKALAEMMETEMMLNTISSGDNMERVRHARLAPPGFSHMNAFGMGMPRPQGHQGYNSNSAMFSDWTQMDPAIMSTSVSLPKLQPPQAGLTPQQQELFARFNTLNVQPNGISKHQVPVQQQWGGAKLWGGAYSGIPLPPGFAPTKAPAHPAECIDAK